MFIVLHDDSRQAIQVAINTDNIVDMRENISTKHTMIRTTGMLDGGKALTFHVAEDLATVLETIARAALKSGRP